MFVRTTDPNDMDKRVRYDEWKRFFDPLFRAAIAKLEQKIEAASERREVRWHRPALGNLSADPDQTHRMPTQDKAATTPKSHIRARWWLWVCLLASTTLILLVNLLLVSESTTSLEPTRFKARAKAQTNVEANIINMIVVSDELNNTEQNDNASYDGDMINTASSATDQSSYDNRVDPSNSAAQSGVRGKLGGSAAPQTFATPRIQTHTHNIRNEYEVADEAELAPKRLHPPAVWPPFPGSPNECLYLHDYGLLERLSTLSSSHCAGDSSSSPYTFYQVPGINLKATKIDNFVLDMRSAQVAHNINSLAQDGGGHDPRFKYTSNFSFCDCDGPQHAANGAPNIWEDLVAGQLYFTDTTCRPLTSEMPRDVVTVKRAVVVVRKDDHNPFFQISGILNAWIMMKVLGWKSSSTQLVTLDRALPSPVDDLRHAMLAPNRVVIGGDELQKRVLHLESALLAPYEARGPMMSHLNDVQPCYANEMIKDFRDEALKNMNVAPQKTDPKRCLITIISRRPYGGRTVQRVWQNEGEILHHMRSEYKGVYRFGECEFQSLDFVNMTMRDQMQVMVDSDIVIGMVGSATFEAEVALRRQPTRQYAMRPVFR
ncbi:hypothetical protein ON010_g12013 [Phytophthora cinnamomi]|nr:hypothetical protein ON010_g12013 [Phytophthora cinnamomi]